MVQTLDVTCLVLWVGFSLAYPRPPKSAKITGAKPKPGEDQQLEPHAEKVCDGARATAMDLSTYNFLEPNTNNAERTKTY